MLIVEKVKVFNFEGAMRGLRNPKDSWHLSIVTSITMNVFIQIQMLLKIASSVPCLLALVKIVFLTSALKT